MTRKRFNDLTKLHDREYAIQELSDRILTNIEVTGLVIDHCEQKNISDEFSWTGDVFVLNQGVHGGIVSKVSSPSKNSLLYEIEGEMFFNSYENGNIKSLKSKGDLLGLVVNNPATGDFFRIEKFDGFSLKPLPPIYPPEIDD